MVPVTGLCSIGAVVGVPALLKVVPVEVGAVVGVVVLVNRIRAGVGIGWVGHALAAAEVVVVPWIGRFAVEPRRPQHDLVLVQHAVSVVVEVDVVPQPVVVVVPWGDPRCRRG